VSEGGQASRKRKKRKKAASRGEDNLPEFKAEDKDITKRWGMTRKN
jgi:hypothetical protein